jgi:hypothetical protein
MSGESCPAVAATPLLQEVSYTLKSDSLPKLQRTRNTQQQRKRRLAHMQHPPRPCLTHLMGAMLWHGLQPATASVCLCVI